MVFLVSLNKRLALSSSPPLQAASQAEGKPARVHREAPAVGCSLPGTVVLCMGVCVQDRVRMPCLLQPALNHLGIKNGF